ncbi:MAG: hypothetical protein IJQ12_10310 [Lachnospiraceae bacterium]|nr:hypothetical protein [Lachnospiraceae bacterium]
MNRVGTVEPQAQELSTQQTKYRDLQGTKEAHAPTGGVQRPDVFAGGLKTGHALQESAYASKKTAWTEGMAAGDKSLSAMRDMDVVLSHMLSPADYRKAKEEGYDPAEIDAKETVTIVDHIKASLLQSGQQISGVTDDLSTEQLRAITGSEAYARQLQTAFYENDLPLTRENVLSVQEALQRAGELTPVGSETMLYMVENGLRPTIDNLYLASHSARGRADKGEGFFAQDKGYLAQSAQGQDMEALASQIGQVIEKAGFDPADKTVQKEAKELVAAGIALTTDHLKAAHDLYALRLPAESGDVITAAACALAEGKEATKADLSDPVSILHKAHEIDTRTKALTDEDLKTAVAFKDTDTKEALSLGEIFRAAEQRKVQEGEALAKDASRTAVSESDPRFMQARMQLEEVRFSMSVSANLTLLRSGFTIDTAPMQELITRLQEAIGEQARALFEGVESSATQMRAEFAMSASVEITDPAGKYRLYQETNVKVSYLRTQMPVGVIGALKDEFRTDTLDDIFSRAQTWKTADKAYESMQTEVRRDLGDSIKKAFRNADALLEEIGMQPSADRLRAVRILAYNRMEVTATNVEKVSAYDARLNEVLDALKPAAVLDLIRSGKNPLSMTLEELAAELREREGSQEGASSKYSRFLYQLERQQSISEAERTSYIGIYRMFETLQRTDHAAIGTLLETGAEMTIKNLLTATRTLRTQDGKGISLTADDGADGYKITRGTESIDTQIGAAFRYYSAKAETAFEHLAPEKLQMISNPEGTLLPEFAEQMETLPEDTAAAAAYDAEQLQALRETMAQAENNITSGFDIVEHLRSGDLPVTATNMEAMQALRAAGSRKTPRTLWEEIKELTGDKKTSDITEEATRTLADLPASDGEPEMAYRAQTETLSRTIKEQMLLNETGYVDHRAMSLMHRALSVAGHMAERGSFEIPVEKDGRTISMHVTLQSSADASGRAIVTIETESMGTIGAQIGVADGALSSMISTDYGETPQVKRYLGEVRARFCAEVRRVLPALQTEEGSQSLLYHVTPFSGAPGGHTERTRAKTLITLATAFAKAV